MNLTRKLELRDLIAISSLHAMLSNHVTSESIAINLKPSEYESSIAKAVYKMADAMLEQRNK